LDAVMSQLVYQPLPTAEETLDRLINEIIVLDGVEDVPIPTDDEVEARISSLALAWNVEEAAIVSALQEDGLTRTDFTARVARLIQVEAALEQLSAQEPNLDQWLGNARAAAEIGVYRSLLADSPPLQTQAAAAARVEQVEPAPANEAALQEEAAEVVFAPPANMPESPYPENAAPDFTLPLLGGGSLSLSDLRGKPTIINFWATWCPPCRRELPALQAAYTAHSDEIGFVAVDVKEKTSKVASFVEELGLTFPVVLDQNGQISDITYQVRGLPTTIFVDARGVVAARHVGPLNESLIEDYLAPLLEPSPPEAAGAAEASQSTPAVSMLGPPAQSAASDPMEPAHNNQPDSAEPVGELPQAADFSLTAANGETISLQDYRDQQNVVLVFYRGHT
jgi:peroxiredoxin